mmetsp:Transcript_15422/g.21971  ORF Transcript_15422/g.21971 Transcript_15422/m.21971 type:complete len:400 (+) Transcript_15422:439-1638(+)
MPGRRDVYHGCGWLPGGRRDVQVVTPNAFSQTKWCRRKLMCEDEWLQVLDFPVGVMKALREEEKERMVKDSAISPLKALSVVCREVHKSIAESSTTASAGVVVEANQAKGKVMVDAMAAVIAKSMEGEAESRPEKESDRMAKATKSDDAEVPEYLWDDRLLEGLGMIKTAKVLAALNSLRSLFLCWWKRKVTRSFLVWWLAQRYNGDNTVPSTRLVRFDHEASRFVWMAKGLKQYRAMRNQRRVVDPSLAEDAADAIRRSSNSSWWEWTEGSFPFFWRWPAWYQTHIREGCAPWLSGDIPKCRIPQQKDKDEKVCEGMRKKLEVPIAKGYLELGLILSLTSFFAVPKGLDDIRMVYDGTKSGLNDAMFAPWFPLPTVEQLLRVVEDGSYMGDIDDGKSS